MSLFGIRENMQEIKESSRRLGQLDVIEEVEKVLTHAAIHAWDGQRVVAGVKAVCDHLREEAYG